MEKVSVVIPCYKQAHFLHEALASIVAQTHSNWECFIVDDGSPDSTKEVATQWCAADSRIHYLYKENGGLASARNFGIQYAKSNYIVTLDADDKYEATFIEKALHVIKSNPKIGVVSSWVVRFNDREELVTIKPNGKILLDFLFQNACNGTSFFRKKCWSDVGGYDERMKTGYEDWDFYISVCSLGWEIYSISEPLFFYRQHETSMRLDAYEHHDKSNKMYLFDKHKALYLNNYEALVSFFLDRVAAEKYNVIKTQNKVDFRVGRLLLYPLRKIKSLLR